eukprot:5945896-Alexandrium_andersonii.AAC.1
MFEQLHQDRVAMAVAANSALKASCVFPKGLVDKGIFQDANEHVGFMAPRSRYALAVAPASHTLLRAFLPA